MFSSLGKIFGIRVGGEGSDYMDGQKVTESGITVRNMYLSVFVFYSLVLVMFVIAFVEMIFPRSFGSILSDVF